MIPFCPGCGAEVVEGTRFCVKCGQPVGQAASPPVYAAPPPPPAVPAALVQQRAPPAKGGAGAGVWIGIIGLLLLVGGAGLWFYSTRAQATSTVQVAATPVTAPAPSTPATPEVIPPNPDFAKPEVIPPNPDFAKKDQAPPAVPAQPARPKPAANSSAPVSKPAPARPVKPAASPTSGVLHASVEVAQNGEVVFENLPGARLKFTFDHQAWRPTISHQTNGTQTLVMRSLKPGIQTTCDVRWEIVP